MSDQDFFFDEDEKPAAKSGSKKSSGSSKGTAPAVSEPVPVSAQSVPMTVMILVAVIALLLGVVIGLFVGKGMATPVITAGTVGTGAAVSAPQLTQEQMNTQQLPPGHPNLPDASSGDTPTK